MRLRRPRRRGAPLAATLAMALAARTAQADLRPTRAVVSPARCDEAAWAGRPYAALVVEELGAMGVPSTIEDEGAAQPATPPGAVSIRIDVTPCAADAPAVTLVMTEALTRARREREVDLENVAIAARPRALALEVAELVRAGWTDAPPRMLPSRRDGYGAPKAALRIEAAAETRVYPRGGAAFFGGRAGVLGPLASWLLWRVDAGAALGGGKDTLGDVTAAYATGGAGVLALGGARPLAFGAGPRLDLGVAWFSGHATSAAATSASGSGLVANLGADALLFARIADEWDLVFEAEGGVAVKTLAATADDRTVIDVGGAFVAIRVGLALSP